MPGPALRLHERSFRRLVIAAGLCWSIAFVVIALNYQLELYGDGAMFSYAVAVQDVWAFHWHNISGRTSVFLLTLLPAETLVAITGNPWAGIVTYGIAVLRRSTGGIGVDLRGRSLAWPPDLSLRVRLNRPALSTDFRLSHRNVACPRDLLADAGAKPLRETNRSRSHIGICDIASAGLYA